MDITSSTQDGIVNLNFVLPVGATQETCSPGLICAYQACEENGLNPTWVNSEECLKLTPGKQDVFVIEPFEGIAFEYLRTGFKCVRVLGPRCLLTCLHRKEPIPELPSPIHNTAMKGLVITTTGFDKQEKSDLQSKVERMAGIYSNNFHEGVTHLVVKSVGSKKYIVAMEKEMPVMTGEWILAVWEAVNKDFREDVVATDEQFLSQNCPPLYGLTICLSQISRKDKDVLKKMITNNGGTYSPSLEMDKTHVLILPAAEGEKYNYAKNWRIHCLSPEWIYDSIEKGYAMDMDQYKVQKEFGASSPKKDVDAEDLLPPDISMCSTIMLNESQLPMTKIDETMNSTLMPGGMSFISATKKSPSGIHNERVAKALEAVDQLELQAAKKAGLFLDGCKIFTSGFDESQMEKLRRILNNGGATRFNQLTEAVSHVVIGKIENEHISTISKWLDKPHVVYGDWIAECVAAKTQVDEGPYSYFTASLNQEETASPFPKPKEKPEAVTPVQDETFVDEALMQQYMKGPAASRRMSSIGNDSLNTSALPASQADVPTKGIFTGKTITISGYTEEQTEELSALLNDEGGELLPLDHPGRVDFSCASLTGEGQVHPHAKESFSHLYVEQCHEFKALISMEYFYLPLVFRHDPPPLEGCVIAISTYKGMERSFLVSVAQLLGAEFQEMFAKKDNPKKGVRCSTHLICSEPEGDKYKAAVKWGVPAVTRDFLLQSASMGQHVSEDDFRVDNEDRIVLDPLAVMKDLLGVESPSNTKVDYSPTRVEDTNQHDLSSNCGNLSYIAPTPVNKKVRALRDTAAADLPSPSNIMTPDLETMRRMYPTPGTKANDSLDQMPTPETPYGSTWHGPNPPARIRKGFKRMLDALPDDKPPAKKANTPTRDMYNQFFEGVQKSLKAKEAQQATKSGTVKKTPTRVNPAVLEDTLKEDMETTEANEMTSADQIGLLSGVVAFTNQKLRDQQQDLYQTIASMGGDYRWVYESGVTHYIHTGRANDTNKEFRQARDQGKFIVAPEWVWMCRDEESRIDESLFPHTHNPKMQLSIISQKSGTPVGTRKGRPRRSEKLTIDETAEASQMSDTPTRPQLSSESDADPADGEEAKKAAALSKQLEELEALANKTGSGRKNAALRKPSLSERAKNTPPRSGGTPRSAHHTPSNAAMQANTEVAESQNTAITWEDPQEREARQRINAELTRDTQEILDDQMQQQKASVIDDDKENTPDNDIKPDPHSKQSLAKVFENNSNHSNKTNYIFVLSGLNDPEDRDRYVEIIEDLGGTLCQEQTWDPSVTHLVTIKPNRSEKILSAIASGRWVLYVSYLEASVEAGKFAKEEEHEWGNPSAVDLPEFDPDTIEEKLGAAAHRWRTALTTDGECKGAFQNMRAIIHSSKERVQALTRLVNSGNGEVIAVKPPYTEGTEITHFFVEQQKNPSKYDMAHFVSQKIPCLAPVYLSNYLINYPIPDAYECCIDEYKKIEQDMRGLLDSEPLMDD